MLACIAHVEGIMSYNYSMCIFTILNMMTSTGHETPLTETLLLSSPFHFTLDGWHVGGISCKCIFWSDACINLNMYRSFCDPP